MFYCIVFLTANCFAQKNDTPTNSQLSQFYKRAIHDFLIEAKAVYQLQLDTLSIAKHDQFPAIKLPVKIT